MGEASSNNRDTSRLNSPIGRQSAFSVERYITCTGFSKSVQIARRMTPFESASQTRALM